MFSLLPTWIQDSCLMLLASASCQLQCQIPSYTWDKLKEYSPCTAQLLPAKCRQREHIATPLMSGNSTECRKRPCFPKVGFTVLLLSAGPAEASGRLLQPATYQVDTCRICSCMLWHAIAEPCSAIASTETPSTYSYTILKLNGIAGTHGSATGSIMQCALRIKALHAHAERPGVHSQEPCESWRSHAAVCVTPPFAAGPSR